MDVHGLPECTAICLPSTNRSSSSRTVVLMHQIMSSSHENGNYEPDFQLYDDAIPASCMFTNPITVIRDPWIPNRRIYESANLSRGSRSDPEFDTEFTKMFRFDTNVQIRYHLHRRTGSRKTMHSSTET